MRSLSYRRKRGAGDWEGSYRNTASETYGIKEVTVNEQNSQAVGLYEHMGFRTCKKTSCDEEGGPYPLLYMKLERA